MTARYDRPEPVARLRRFARADDGGMILLGIVFLTLMLMIGGLAVDLMRFEATRTALQQTTDRAVLAAASLKQKLDPESVVRDYFEKAGLSDKINSISVVQSFNARSVSVDASAEVDPYFMRMLGVSEMQAPAMGTAIEKINDVEISLVLDISGSMDSSNRLINLKVAAKEFVDTIFAGAQPGRTTISIIPFSGHVNLGDSVSSVFNMTRLHTTSYCMDLPSSTFTSTTISQATAFAHAAHQDPFQGTGTRTASLFFCPPSANNTVIPFSDDPAFLKSRIQALDADGNTSIDIGMKWGTTFLDPASNGIITSLVANNTVKALYADRPLNKANREVLKVIVLMTDGENTAETVIKDPYRTGMSNIYIQTSTNRLAAYHNRANTVDDYWSLDGSNNGTWSSQPFNSATGWTQLTWPQVWATAPLQYVTWNLYSKPLGQADNTTWMNAFRTTAGTGTKNTRLQQICNASKTKGNIVFGIAFEAPAGGTTQIRSCSTSAGHFYNVTGLQISTAFRSIANQIANLRLTQ